MPSHLNLQLAPFMSMCKRIFVPMMWVIDIFFSISTGEVIVMKESAPSLLCDYYNYSTYQWMKLEGQRTKHVREEFQKYKRAR